MLDLYHRALSVQHVDAVILQRWTPMSSWLPGDQDWGQLRTNQGLVLGRSIDLINRILPWRRQVLNRLSDFGRSRCDD